MPTAINKPIIQDVYPLEVLDTKTVIKEGKNGKKPALKVTGIFQKADTKNANGRIYPQPILKEAVHNIQDEINKRAVMGEFDHPCITTPHFSVLTTEGWKQFRDVKIGDTVYSRVNGEMVPSKVNGIIDKPFSGTVYHFEGRHIDITLTGDHKVIMDARPDRTIKQIGAKVNQIVEDRKLYNKCLIPRTAEWSGDDINEYIIPGIHPTELKSSINSYKNDATKDLNISAETFVAFLGLWLAEGNLCSNYGIFINQFKDDYKPEIEEMLKTFPEELQWTKHDGGYYVADARLYNYLKPLGNKYTKYIPNDVKQLDGKLLDELVYWFQIGGGRKKHGRNNIFSVSKQLIDDLHECHIKSGGCCYETAIEPKVDYEFGGHTITATRKKVLHQLTLSQTKGIYMDERFLKITPEQYSGNVYCLMTEHGNFYMQHAGCSYWTGNCDAKIHLDRVSHVITKLWMEGKTVYGEAEILADMPCGAMLATLLKNDVQVGISSRGVGDMEMAMEGREEIYKVNDGYSIITFDMVAEPSVQSAVMTVCESKSDKILTRSVRAQLDPAAELVREFKKWLR